MRWPFRRPQEPAARLPHAWPMPPPPPRHGGAASPATSDADIAAFMAFAFVCSTCGRDDLEPAGDWDPPICLECDAAINFDAEVASGAFDDVFD